MESPCGHVDFYPNGGADQPGCSLFDMPVSLDSMVGADSTAADTMGRHLVACSHNRGIDLYIESLRSTTCDFMGHECHSYEAFEQGNCFACGLHGEKCAILGERAIEYKQYISAGGMMQHHKFYLKTGKKSSFCRKCIADFSVLE
jgi:pancreatic triacylglycerol lipase